VAASSSTQTSGRRDAIDVARVLALAMVVAGHLVLAVIDRPDGEVRGANLLLFRPGLAFLTVVAPMPVFFAAGGYANASATLMDSARRLRVLAAVGAVVVSGWSVAVVVTVLITGDSGIVGDGARLATQPLWFLAAYVPFAAGGRGLARLAGKHPVLSIGGCLAALAVLDLARFGLDAPSWIGWIGFGLAWVVPWLAGGWWRHRVEHGGLDERRVGATLAVVFTAVCVVLVHAFGYSAALIDVVPGARSNTTPPTLYTAVVALAQVGVLLFAARWLDRVGRRWRRLWDRAGEAAIGVYAWHLTALALCAAAIAIGVPSPVRFTLAWWLSRPLWWAAVLAVAFGLVLATDRVRNRFERAGPGPGHERGGARQLLGVITLTAAGAAVGLEGPREAPTAVAWSALFALSWWLLSEPRRAGPSGGGGASGVGGTGAGAGGAVQPTSRCSSTRWRSMLSKPLRDRRLLNRFGVGMVMSQMRMTLRSSGRCWVSLMSGIWPLTRSMVAEITSATARTSATGSIVRARAGRTNTTSRPAP
jgi:hypothetical protein